MKSPIALRQVIVAMVGAAVVSIGISGGCARGKKNTSAKVAAKAPPVSRSEVERLRDPAEQQALRERAVAILESLATHPNPQIRANAIEALAEAPTRLEPLIPRALQDGNLGVRSTAAMMVGKATIKSAAGATRVLLKDPSPYVRASAIYALKRCGEEVDLNPLAEMLLTDPAPRVRSHAAFLIGELGEKSAAGLLRDAVKAKMPKAPTSEVRIMQLQLAEAMAKLGDDTQVEVIRAALYPSQPEDLEAAALAVQIIGQIGDKGAIDQLIYLTAYRDPQAGQMPAEIRLGAAMSLAKLGKTEGTFIVNEYAASPLPVLRSQAALAYGQIGRTENLPRLEQMLNDPEGIARVSAAAGVLKTSSAMAGYSGGM